MGLVRIRWSLVRLLYSVETGCNKRNFRRAGFHDNEVGIDAALKGDIDFEAIRKENEVNAHNYYQDIANKCGGSIPKLELFWETIRDGQEFTHLSIDDKRALYHSQDAIKRWKEVVGDDLFGPQLERFQCSEDDFVYRSLQNVFVPYAVVMNGEWHGSGDMGWWGISTNKIPHEEWQNKVGELLQGLPDDTLISFYDCHI